MQHRTVRSLAAAILLATAAGATGLAVAASPSPAYAFDPASPADVNVDKQGVILQGYDPVAYFTDNKAVKGSPTLSATRSGATYYFSSAKNRDLFLADPAKYEPQYGGFCAMGVAMAKKLDGDPELFHVIDGKLYLNVNDAAQKRWLQDVPGFTQRAAETWPSLRGKTPAELN